MAADIAAQAALKRLHKEEPKVSYGQKKIQMIVSRIKFAGLDCLLFILVHGGLCSSTFTLTLFDG